MARPGDLSFEAQIKSSLLTADYLDNCDDRSAALLAGWPATMRMTTTTRESLHLLALVIFEIET